jgi:UDP-N-acetylmuramoyl-tripeptide--D-alanyl-D-alanine ligase
MKAAFQFMTNLNSSKKKIAVLGDMFELGDKSVEAHIALSIHIRKNKIDEVYTVGKFMKHFVNSLKESGIRCKHFTKRELLEQFLIDQNFDNSVILLKGSRGMKMEEFLKFFEGKS